MRSSIVSSVFSIILLACAAAGCSNDVGNGSGGQGQVVVTPDAGTSVRPDAQVASGGRDASTALLDAGRAADATVMRADGGGADGGGGLGAFGATCTGNATCQSNLCFTFNATGMQCTKRCTAATAATDCPTVNGVNLGCNGMLVCKTR